MHARILTYILGLGREWIKQRVGVAEGKSSSGGFTGAGVCFPALKVIEQRLDMIL